MKEQMKFLPKCILHFSPCQSQSFVCKSWLSQASLLLYIYIYLLLSNVPLEHTHINWCSSGSSGVLSLLAFWTGSSASFFSTCGTPLVTDLPPGQGLGVCPGYVTYGSSPVGRKETEIQRHWAIGRKHPNDIWMPGSGCAKCQFSSSYAYTWAHKLTFLLNQDLCHL